jgi:hypothetical protein
VRVFDSIVGGTMDRRDGTTNDPYANDSYGNHGSQPAPGYGSQSAPGFGSQPPPDYGGQPPPMTYGNHPAPDYGSQPPVNYGRQQARAPKSKRKRTVPLWVAVVAAGTTLLIGIAAGAGGKAKTDTTASAAVAPSVIVSSVFVTVTVPAVPVATTKPAAAPPATKPAVVATTKPAAAPTTTAAPAAVTIPGDGTYVVGTDIKPGLYKTSGPAPDSIGDCYWERDKDLNGGFDSILANDNTKGQTTVKILSTDAAFKTTGCADWTKIG